ncbi:MAG: hypothetical protein GC186_20640 [Rhodobacteraceae bacterium]|nr:hypothetical protein [Paracoccaceae bacterium]
MNVRLAVPLIALLALSGSAAFAQTSGSTDKQSPMSIEQMDQRFQQMTTMMGSAQNAHGDQLTQLMQQHMQLMLDQMTAMHSMMAGGGMMGGQMAGQGNMGTSGNADALAQMKTRLDLMQQMMEQMLDQQKLMMPTTPGK